MVTWRVWASARMLITLRLETYIENNQFRSVVMSNEYLDIDNIRMDTHTKSIYIVALVLSSNAGTLIIIKKLFIVTFRGERMMWW